MDVGSTVHFYAHRFITTLSMELKIPKVIKIIEEIIEEYNQRKPDSKGNKDNISFPYYLGFTQGFTYGLYDFIEDVNDNIFLSPSINLESATFGRFLISFDNIRDFRYVKYLSYLSRIEEIYLLISSKYLKDTFEIDHTELSNTEYIRFLCIFRHLNNFGYLSIFLLNQDRKTIYSPSY